MGVTQGLLSVEAQADVAAVGRRRTVARARALIVTAAATHRAWGPGRPAGPGAVCCGRKHLCHFTVFCIFYTPAADALVSFLLLVVLPQRGIDWCELAAMPLI